MQLSYKIKKTIIRNILKKRKKTQGFDAVLAETYRIADDADANINNSYYFSAHNLEGQSIFIRLGLRGDKQSEIWFTYRDNDLFLSYPTELCPIEASPLYVECIEVEKKWKIIFKGEMQSLTNKETRMQVYFEGVFEATAPIFDFFYHADPEPMASAIAREKWNKAFFQEIQKNNQTHYEQAGKLTGNLSINQIQKQINLFALRDHSFGKRDWNYMDKHMWLMALTENGDALNISTVSYPALSGIAVGNFNRKGKVFDVIHFHTSNDLINNGKGADHFMLQAKLNTGELLQITVERDAEVVYSFAQGQYILREGMGSFTINGEKAKGIIEFGFNKDKNRWYRNNK
jgi:hypothetical protein